jgi:hypothetical protein
MRLSEQDIMILVSTEDILRLVCSRNLAFPIYIGITFI